MSDPNLTAAAKESVILRLIYQPFRWVNSQTTSLLQPQEDESMIAEDESKILKSLLCRKAHSSPPRIPSLFSFLTNSEPGHPQRSQAWSLLLDMLFKVPRSSERTLKELIGKQEAAVQDLHMKYVTSQGQWRNSLINRTEQGYEEWRDSCADAAGNSARPQREFVWHCVVLKLLEKVLGAIQAGRGSGHERGPIYRV